MQLLSWQKRFKSHNLSLINESLILHLSNKKSYIILRTSHLVIPNL